ncbi:MAG: hypothetical protein UT24_C0015G0013 [Candidatus Woesebacteria bacterium GW2011_GWB1_39_12]|uniref:Uncharacterized protein n=1 Tax=Candidatus Woesebacteria bacterium GW2011_GWB1_39_12 TaxID=1618574 RepID=A0A0G0PPW4_9BACT|nr:MAG: hypothetical protein UT24_C0015G0013 [Candidatus Woesebacteria bacterium GW2011_GWB1_39_12]
MIWYPVPWNDQVFRSQLVVDKICINAEVHFAKKKWVGEWHSICPEVGRYRILKNSKENIISKIETEIAHFFDEYILFVEEVKRYVLRTEEISIIYPLVYDQLPKFKFHKK